MRLLAKVLIMTALIIFVKQINSFITVRNHLLP
jgi:hypothetical protein